MIDGRAFRLGIDIGGTFTDFVLVNPATSALQRHKTLTTPEDPSVGVIAGAEELLQQAGVDWSDVERIVHGTTLVANAIVERKGAAAALVVTAGFRDVIEMGRENRYDIYDLNLRRPTPLIPRARRLEVNERIGPDGEVIEALSSQEIDRVVALLREWQIDSVAICLLHSYKNPNHETLLAEAISQGMSGVSVCTSASVAPEIREYDRLSTTIANAYVQPLASRYLGKIEGTLNNRSYKGAFHLELSEGTAVGGGVARLVPIRLVESGPAAGVRYCQLMGSQVGIGDLMAFDMGGTTAKACVVKSGVAGRAAATEVARLSRFRKGSGLVLRVPTIELLEIGAGGGSIARVDSQGLLKVGPESAGASPGPACYGQGGREPTVTDAELVLGYLDASNFLGGRMQLDGRAAHAVIDTKIAGPLAISVEDAALGIYRIAGEQMASAAGVRIAESGADPRKLWLFAMGGAGPMHAAYVAKSLQMKGFICPPMTGIGSAIGLLASPTGYEASRSVLMPLQQEDMGLLWSVLDDLAEQVRVVLSEAGAPEPELEGFVDMRFSGQFYELEVPLHYGSHRAIGASQLRERFGDLYSLRYGRQHDVGVEVVTCRVRGLRQNPLIVRASHSTANSGAPGTRRVYISAGSGWEDCSVYARAALTLGTLLHGPALIEESEATTFISEGMLCNIDEWGNLIVTIGGES